ncbi:MAG TPA: hypothetical protein VLM85_29570 [Polyangiaceae bacterium]|nr:hypothetical protein [Polyangiaceae bacterium]
MSDAPERPLSRMLDAGPAAQPLVAGLLAWIVTVAPVGYAKHAPWGAALFASLALLALGRGAVAEWLLRRTAAPAPHAAASVDRNRIVTLVTFALASTVTWLCDTDALTPIRFSAARGVAGVLGWLLFAFACSAPAVEGPRPGVAGAVRVEVGPRARGRVARGDAIFVGVATLLAALLQVIGWTVASPERAVLVRLVTVTSAVVLLGAASVLLSARHGAREASPDPKRRAATRRRVPLGWLVALALMLAAGVLYALMPGGG